MTNNVIPGIMAGRQNKNWTIIRWTLENPTLLDGELGIVSDLPGQPFKFGNGKDAWNDLPYAGSGPIISNEMYLSSAPGTRQPIKAGDLFTVPTYTVYQPNTTDSSLDGNILRGNLIVNLSRMYCWEYPRGCSTPPNPKVGWTGIGDAYEQVGEVGETNNQIKWLIDVGPEHFIEVQYFPTRDPLFDPPEPKPAINNRLRYEKGHEPFVAGQQITTPAYIVGAINNPSQLFVYFDNYCQFPNLRVDDHVIENPDCLYREVGDNGTISTLIEFKQDVPSTVTVETYVTQVASE